MNKTKIQLLPFGLALAGTFGNIRCEALPVQENDKMNVVFILADDLGWSDLGCYGSRFYETPNIDRLAKEGVRFTNAYAACHVCSPTRASILTGQYPARLGLTDWLPGRKNFPFQLLRNVQSAQHLPYEANMTFASVLKSNGYKTAIIGKWHLGEDSASCERQGFDQHIPSGWMKGWPAKSYFSPYLMPGLEDGPEGEYLTNRLTEEAIHFMEHNKNSPFLLYLSHYAVHDPVQGPPNLVVKYRSKLNQFPSNFTTPYILEGNPDSDHSFNNVDLEKLIKKDEYQKFSVLPNRTVKIKQNQDNPEFAAMVESLDMSVGRILTKLKDLGLEEKTLVVFFSDNGGMSAANFGNPDRIINPANLDKAYSTSNLPLRAGKGWLYEGGIRVPLIVKWPNHGMKGGECEVPVISTDFYPTILDLLGLNSGNHLTDGKSMAPLLTSPISDRKHWSDRAIFWHFPHYSNHGMQSPGSAIRMGDYKLIEYFENNTVQLFNLAEDPGELNDLSGKMPVKVNKLKRFLHEWRKNVNAQTMVQNPDYDPGTKNIIKK